MSNIPGPYVTCDSVHEDLVMKLLAIRTAAGNAERHAEIDHTPRASIRVRPFCVGKVDDVTSMSVEQQFVRVSMMISEIDGFVVRYGK